MTKLQTAILSFAMAIAVLTASFAYAASPEAFPTPSPTRPNPTVQFPVDMGPTIPIPLARDIIESAGWLSRQQVTVWLALVTILLGLLIYAIIRHLLKSIDGQRDAYKEELKEMRLQFAMLQTEEKQLSLQLLQYLEKDHTQTIVLVKENQTIMQETVTLLRDIQQERHDEKLLRKENNDILKRLDPETRKNLVAPGPQ